MSFPFRITSDPNKGVARGARGGEGGLRHSATLGGGPGAYTHQHLKPLYLAPLVMYFL